LSEKKSSKEHLTRSPQKKFANLAFFAINDSGSHLEHDPDICIAEIWPLWRPKANGFKEKYMLELRANFPLFTNRFF
jgi:hypothetical protein